MIISDVEGVLDILEDGGRAALDALLTKAIEELHEEGTPLYRRDAFSVQFLIYSDFQLEAVMRRLTRILVRAPCDDFVEIYNPGRQLPDTIDELLQPGAVWYQGLWTSGGTICQATTNPWPADRPLEDVGSTAPLGSSSAAASDSGPPPTAPAGQPATAASAPPSATPDRADDRAPTAAQAPQPGPPATAAAALAPAAPTGAPGPAVPPAGHTPAVATAHAPATLHTPAGPPQGPPPLAATPGTGGPWTTVGRSAGSRPPGGVETESWSPALDPQLWGMSRATALVTDLEIRLAVTGIPAFWTPVSVGEFLRALGIVAACITAITIKRPVNKPPIAFVNVSNQETADKALACSGTKQGRSGDPPIMISAAHKPGVCSACGQTGHTKKQCVQCKHCRAWGHSSAMCPVRQDRARSLSPPTTQLATPGPPQGLVPTWHLQAEVLPPDVERALALQARTLQVHPRPAAPPQSAPLPAVIHNFHPAPPGGTASFPAPIARPQQTVAPTPEWPSRVLEPLLAAHAPGLDAAAPPSGTTPGMPARAAHPAMTSPAQPAAPSGLATARARPASSSAARHRLQDRLHAATQALQAAALDSAEEEAALIMVERLQFALQRHDATTDAPDGPSTDVRPPQTRPPP